LTALVDRALNPNVGKNQHRWKSFLGGDICGVLDDAAARLAWAWTVDMKYPKSFPMNTSFAFDEINEWIKECQRGGEPKVERKGLPNPRSRSPKRFSDLVDDRVIRAVFEDQNVGSYSDALKLADSGDKAAHFTFRKILKAVAPAYRICHFGDDAAPKPRVHFLHRRLLELATSLDLSDLTHEGIVEFLDDLCPCGKRHTADAIRKLRERAARRGPKS
jgi:hypothetical protein